MGEAGERVSFLVLVNFLGALLFGVGVVMKKGLVFVCIWVSLLSFSAGALASVNVQSLLNFVIKNRLFDDSLNEVQGVGQSICLSSGRPSYECGPYTRIGQGICLSGGRPSYECGPYTSIGQGICLSSGRPSYECGPYTSVGQGICLLSGRPSYECGPYTQVGQGICLSSGRPSYECGTYMTLSQGIEAYNEYNSRGDRDWDWDQFYHSSGKLVWACRGIQTGRFAESERCRGKPQTDYRWPNK